MCVCVIKDNRLDSTYNTDEDTKVNFFFFFILNQRTSIQPYYSYSKLRKRKARLSPRVMHFIWGVVI